MIAHFFSALRISLLCLLLFSGAYTLLVWGLARFMPWQGRGHLIEANGKTFYANVGQHFDKEHYFWSRPSAVAYNAAGSGGSNKGPANPDYLAQVQARLDTFLVHHPGVPKAQVPAELLTASGSGLDPHISPVAALVQVGRVARANGLPEARVKQLLAQYTEGPWLGIFGPSKINVLKINLAIQKAKTN